MPCRLNRLRLWQGRLLLESTQHPSSLFVTLTYSDEFLPHKGWLKPVDLQRYLKRVRRSHDSPVRFFAVGEYGDKTWRPHFHLALFGDFRSEQRDDRLYHAAVVDSWKFGHVHLGLLTPQSAAYMTRYTVKRMCRDGDPRLDGRTPEFVRMSLRPGIGKLALQEMGTHFLDRKGCAFLAASGDVPTQFIHQGKRYSLGRYLQTKLREEIGREPGTPVRVQLERSAKRLGEDKVVRESVRRQHGNIAAKRVQSVKSKDTL